MLTDCVNYSFPILTASKFVLTFVIHIDFEYVSGDICYNYIYAEFLYITVL